MTARIAVVAGEVAGGKQDEFGVGEDALSIDAEAGYQVDCPIGQRPVHGLLNAFAVDSEAFGMMG